MYLHELIDLLSNIFVDDDKEVEVYIEFQGVKQLINNVTLKTVAAFNYVDDTEEITRTIIMKK